MMEHNLGTSQIGLLKWLTGDWLTAGKPVCFLEGFPGIGKTTIARELEVQLKQPYQVVRVDMSESETDPVGDLLLEVATSLHEVGRKEIANAIDGGRDKAVLALVSLLRSSPVVIIVDEFQRTFQKDEGRPVHDVEALIVRIAQRANSRGRVLLLTNRRVGRERWSEPYEIRTLPGLTVEEAERLLESRLANEGRSDEVPMERRRDVVNWLGRNPRAIGVLVEALAGDSLDFLIRLNPESWEARDREVSAELLRRLERNLLEKNLERLAAEVAALLYQLAVYRRAFKREAMQLMAAGAQDFEVMKSELVSRFFMEQHRGWFSLHEIVREIALDRLKQNSTAFRQAHARAGEYFARPFKAKQMVGGELGSQFVEARYHLVQAQREQELNDIANRFGNYLKETYSEATPIPRQQNELDERIAVLSALLVMPGPKSLEYYLARLLKHRGNPTDIKRALEHVRVATDSRDASAHRWMLRIQLEEQVNGIAEAVNVARQGIARVPRDKNLFSLYQVCAELMDKAGRTDEAVALLKDGISEVPRDQSVPLYKSCAGLMVRAGKIDDAIALLKEGCTQVPPENNYHLYIYYAELLTKARSCLQAIHLLREGMRSFPLGQWNRYYLVTSAIYLCAVSNDEATLGDILSGLGKDAVEPQQLWLGNVVRLQMQQKWEQAAEHARHGRSNFPTYLPLAIQEAFSWLCANRPEVAEQALREFPKPIKMSRDSAFSWLAAFIALRNRELTKALDRLATYLGHSLIEEDVNEYRLLSLWDVPVESLPINLFGTRPAFFFPTLPPSVTGLAKPITLKFGGQPVLPHLLKLETQAYPAITTIQTSGQATLVLATEWESKYGGLSTFNRELCKSMSRAGHRVCCLVPRATPDEIAASKAVGVELVLATPTEEASDRELLSRRPALPSGFEPLIVVGHDRITGAPAQAQVADFFPQARFVLFIHTAPGEIEWYKARSEGENTAAETAEQREKTQRELARSASLVVAVGPRLKREIEANLVGLNIPVMQLNPGLGETRQPGQPLAAIYCLLLGRAEDENLKGLDIAARALGQLLQKQPSPFSVEPELIIRGAAPKTGDQLRQSLISISGANLNVRVKEYTPELERITEDIRRASVVLMPSRREGFGLVGLEAITEGIPVLISSKSGLGELLRDKLPSEIVSPCVIQVSGNLETDAQVWSEATKFVLLDREAAFARAAELQKLLGNSVSWEQGVSQLFQVLADVVSSSSM
jgi:glycosyltransferase involved in cell wall biosynthesis/tetratricopeptide (TPR) repeat protein